MRLAWCVALRLAAVIFHKILLTTCCDELFDGFGIHLGSMGHFSRSPSSAIHDVFDKTYNDLGIRLYRTSIESSFSPSRDVYEIKCESPPSAICSYIEIHKEIAKYPNISVMASIWSPPHYMKNEAMHTLLPSEERNYYYFIKNVTSLMQQQFNITIERVSPANEPENIFAPWEHTNMGPQQLCRMVHDFNDPLVSVCPENSYYWISEFWANSTEKKSKAKDANVTCLESCEIFGTHAYALNLGGGEDNMLAYYDKVKYPRKLPGKKIWQTEVCSTYPRASERQMDEALDMAVNIVNFVGHTCIQRYYLWYSYTLYSSGESLIWGDDHGVLTFPKKYFAYKHFTQAAFGGTKRVTKCGLSSSPSEVHCLRFGESNAVFVNTLNVTVPYWNTYISCHPGSFCCTSGEGDWFCPSSDSTTRVELPSSSVCSCRLQDMEKISTKTFITN